MLTRCDIEDCWIREEHSDVKMPVWDGLRR